MHFYAPRPSLSDVHFYTPCFAAILYSLFCYPDGSFILSAGDSQLANSSSNDQETSTGLGMLGGEGTTGVGALGMLDMLQGSGSGEDNLGTLRLGINIGLGSGLGSGLEDVTLGGRSGDRLLHDSNDDHSSGVELMGSGGDDPLHHSVNIGGGGGGAHTQGGLDGNGTGLFLVAQGSGSSDMAGDGCGTLMGGGAGLGGAGGLGLGRYLNILLLIDFSF